MLTSVKAEELRVIVVHDFTIHYQLTLLMANASVIISIMIKWSLLADTQWKSFNISWNRTINSCYCVYLEPSRFLQFVLPFHISRWLMLFALAIDGNYHAVSCLLQGSSMLQRRRTGRLPTPTSMRPSRATTPLTAPKPSQRSNTCFCAKSFSTCE